VNANRVGLIGPSMAHRLVRQQRTSSVVERVPEFGRRPGVVTGTCLTSRSRIGSPPDVFEWINVIGTRSPIGEHVFGVGLALCLICRVVPRFADKLAAIGESLEEEPIDPRVNEQDSCLRQGSTGPDIGQISRLRLRARSLDE